MVEPRCRGFQAQFYTTFQGNAVNVRFNNCTSSKLGFGTKREDFVMPEFDFSVFADAAGIGAMILRFPDGQVKAHSGHRPSCSILGRAV